MGKIICTGLGPGDPDLISVRSDRLIRAARHVAYFRKAGRPGQARRIVEGMLAPDVTEYPMEYPVTTELPFRFANPASPQSPSAPAAGRRARPGGSGLVVAARAGAADVACAGRKISATSAPTSATIAPTITARRMPSTNGSCADEPA